MSMYGSPGVDDYATRSAVAQALATAHGRTADHLFTLKYSLVREAQTKGIFSPSADGVGLYVLQTLIRMGVSPAAAMQDLDLFGVGLPLS